MSKIKAGDRVKVYGYTPQKIIIHGVLHIHQPHKSGIKKAVVSKILNDYKLIAHLEDGTEVMPYIKQCRKLVKVRKCDVCEIIKKCRHGILCECHILLNENGFCKKCNGKGKIKI